MRRALTRLLVILPALLGLASAARGDEAPRRDWVFIPALGYSTDTELMGGAMLMRLFGCEETDDPDCRRSNVALSFLYSQKRQVIAALGGENYWMGRRHHLVWRLDYKKFPSTYYGMGRATPVGTEEDYTPRGGSGALTYLRRLGSAWELGASASGGRRSYGELEAGGVLESAILTGSDGYTFAGLGLLVRYDSRDSDWWPRRGLFASLAGTAFRRGLGGDLDWERYGIDLRGYRAVGALGVLALQLALDDAHGDVPFDQLPALGGDQELRGYPGARYRDRSRLLTQLELRRSSLVGPLGVVLFAGLGDVAPRVADLRPGDPRLGGGLGFRYLYDAGSELHLRFDLGWGEQGESSVTMSVGEAF